MMMILANTAIRMDIISAVDIDLYSPEGMSKNTIKTHIHTSKHWYNTNTL